MSCSLSHTMWSAERAEIVLSFFIILSLNNCLHAPCRWFLHKPVWGHQILSAKPLQISFMWLGICGFDCFCCLSSFSLRAADPDPGSFYFLPSECPCVPKTSIAPQHLADTLNVALLQEECSSMHAVWSLRYTLRSCVVTAGTLWWPVYSCRSVDCSNSTSGKRQHDPETVCVCIRRPFTTKEKQEIVKEESPGWFYSINVQEKSTCFLQKLPGFTTAQRLASAGTSRLTLYTQHTRRVLHRAGVGDILRLDKAEMPKPQWFVSSDCRCRKNLTM